MDFVAVAFAGIGEALLWVTLAGVVYWLLRLQQRVGALERAAARSDVGTGTPRPLTRSPSMPGEAAAPPPRAPSPLPPPTAAEWSERNLGRAVGMYPPSPNAVVGGAHHADRT